MHEFVQIPIVLFLAILLIGIVMFVFNIYIMFKWGKDLDELDRLEKAYRRDIANRQYNV
jgi:hypothetical protein|tara:strand:+ start:660 stop:836 length:177 start_codon:yes stop_codon:yes gene_type:complete